jgi:hypothetical protein
MVLEEEEEEEKKQNVATQRCELLWELAREAFDCICWVSL